MNLRTLFTVQTHVLLKTGNCMLNFDRLWYQP